MRRQVILSDSDQDTRRMIGRTDCHGETPPEERNLILFIKISSFEL